MHFRNQGARTDLERQAYIKTVKREEDPDDFFHEMDRRKSRHDQMVIISDNRYEDIINQAIPDKYDNVKYKTYSDRNFDLETIRTTINNIYIDNCCAPAATSPSRSSVEERRCGRQPCALSVTNASTAGRLVIGVTTVSSRNHTDGTNRSTRGKRKVGRASIAQNLSAGATTTPRP